MLVDFFEHTSLYIKIHEKAFMVITIHMYNQMVLENQKKYKNDNMLNNFDSSLIKSFLKNLPNLSKTENSVISSNS